MKNERKNKDVGFVLDRLKSPKFLIVASVVVALLVDVFAMFALIVSGLFNGLFGDLNEYVYLFVIVAFLVLDVLLLAVSLASNFRFRYAFWMPVLYILFVVGIGAFTYLWNGTAYEIILFSDIAMYVLLGIHALVCLAVLFSAIRAAATGKRGRGCKGIASLLFLLLVAASGVYGYTVVENGVFGQGALGKVRSLRLVYAEELDAYSVVGVMSGAGDTVIVPEKFNGKPIESVDCSDFSDASIKNVYLENAEVSLWMTAELAPEGVTDRKIYVAKEDCEDFRDGYYSWSYALLNSTEMTAESEKTGEAYLRLANSVCPDGLKEGEVFVSFEYEKEDFLAVKGEALDIWYGNAGDQFTAAGFAGIDYVANRDAADFDDVYWSYDNLDKRIFNQFIKDGQSIEGTPVAQSLTKVSVAFEDLYQVSVGDDNDTVYETADSFKYQTYGGNQRNPIVTAGTADAYLASIAGRDGFTLGWQYGEGKADFTSLKSVVYDGVTIYPKWTMIAPTIDTIAVSNPTATYGDEVNFSSTATPASSDFSVKYTWKKVDGAEVANASSWTDDCVYPNESGVYELTVETYAATTSLTSTVSKQISLSVGKKALPFLWQELADSVYSATEKPILCSYDMDAIVGSDVVKYTLSLENVRDAGTYTPSVELTDGWDALYYIPTNSVSKTYKVTPYAISVSWGNTDFTYNASNQAPTASATGLGADGLLALTVSGARKYASASAYTATVSTSDKNYTIINATQSFTIAKAGISVDWSNTNLTYNATTQKPTATATGLGTDGPIALTVSGAQTNASDSAYTATATPQNTNYYFVNPTVNFTIDKAPLQVTWGNASFVYNAKNQAPTASARGLGNDGAIALTVSGAQTNASDSAYTATATLQNTNYYFVNPTQSFTIAKAQLAVTWTNTSFTYDGETHQPTATATGLGSDGPIALTVAGAKKAAGQHTATASMSVSNSNYTLTKTSVQFTIAKKAITLTWGASQLTYDGQVKGVDPVVQGIVAGESDVVAFVYEKDGASITKDQVLEAGTYKVTASIADSNYQFANGVQTQFTMVVAPKQITVSFGGVSFDYDGGQKTPTATSSDPQAALKVSYYSVAAGGVLTPLSVAPTEAGNYRIVVETLSGNYTIAGATSVDFAIVEAPLG